MYFQEKNMTQFKCFDKRKFDFVGGSLSSCASINAVHQSPRMEFGRAFWQMLRGFKVPSPIPTNRNEVRSSD
jgi:hypothetical protein